MGSRGRRKSRTPSLRQAQDCKASSRKAVPRGGSFAAVTGNWVIRGENQASGVGIQDSEVGKKKPQATRQGRGAALWSIESI
jgi:hypothetical protein